jgi:subtilisin
MERNSLYVKFTVPLAVLTILSLVSPGNVAVNGSVVHPAYAQSASMPTNTANITAPVSGANITNTAGTLIPNVYIVTVKDNATFDTQASNTAIRALSNEAENKGIQVTQSLPAAGAFIVKTPPNGISALDDVKKDSRVLAIEQAQTVVVSSQSVPTGIQRIDAQPAAATALDGNVTSNPVNATIGIIDTGIDLKHPDLNVVNGVTFVPSTTTANDDNGHGTHVAGIAAAKNNDIGVVGVAPGAKLWAIKVLAGNGAGSSADVLSGINYAIQHAKELDVINLSLGGGFSVAENTAIRRAVEAGITVVVAAGNEHVDASTTSPASAPQAITVSAAVDSDGKCGGLGMPTSRGRDDSFATYSDYGKIVDIMAPGTLINSTWKDDGYKAGLSGTSMAAPHVAGAAALYKSVHHSATANQVLDALLSIASTPTTVCKAGVNGHGYLVDRSADLDDVAEPLLDTQGLVDRH